MSNHNPANERIKREYLLYLKQAKGRNEATIDGVASSLARFEESTKWKDFGRFHRKQAVAFKDKLEAAVNARTGDRPSKSTMLAVLRNLREFFFWPINQASNLISAIMMPTISTSAKKTWRSPAAAARSRYRRSSRFSMSSQ